ncbi:hypothetical protein K1T73_09985 [Roseovarius sp. SCSIO 43702]|uniref:hypothetical protein n=1 Tax=Roseovarius sp. SCSIO 43702 TaxID=2823043 RepID=UPI001C729FDD|nr:hypothetical protein [Roseovarius sp. SCSIO 43702]QYX55439.1 hypothetical protein K1T73_09985 [Roseovarius sp. SCSIO 43702]
MYGVVLWSDDARNRAVVWCDDHGDLAFYRRTGGARAPMPFAAGDLIQFDLKEAAEMRIVSRPRVVERESYPTLTHDLKQAGAAMGALEETCRAPEGCVEARDNVVSLSAHRCAEVA